MRFYFLAFLFLCGFFSAQITTQPKDPLVKEPFFEKAPVKGAPNTEKVKLLHADFSGVKPEKYNGNFYFEGNVKFMHQGSVLTADEVVFYQAENFVKAFGNVRLQNADGSVITSEEMEYDGGSQRGVARKNVELRDPKQTIKTQTLYYDRVSNLAYFDTGGTISDGQNVMYTKSATYDISSRMIDFTGSVRIDNPQYTIEGAKIRQDQRTNTAFFYGPTTITDKNNPLNRIYTELGSFNNTTQEGFLKKNSRIYYNRKTLDGDEIYYNKISGFGKATGNVLLNDPQENRYIKGGYGEIFEKKDSAMITDKPYAVKILENDSIYFGAEKFLSYQKLDSLLQKKSHLRAYNRARMFKSNAQAKADSISFNETDGILHLVRNPVLWSGEKQVTGDKIEAYFDTKREFIDSLKVVGNAFAISKVDSLSLKDEFHQVKGKLMTVHYEENNVKNTKVIGNAQSIIYVDDVDQKTKSPIRVGVALSTCGIIEAFFEERRIQVIECNVGANNDTYPMSKISKEQRFFPDFNWNTKDRLLKWQDIFVESPNNEEKIYESDDALYLNAKKIEDDIRAKEEAKKPKRVRK